MTVSPLLRAEIEGDYLGELTKLRWPILLFVFCFDIMCMSFRIAVKMHFARQTSLAQLGTSFVELMPPAYKMVLLYASVGLLNRRSRM